MKRKGQALRTPYRHPSLGRFHRVKASQNAVSTILVSDAELDGLVEFLNGAEARTGDGEIVQIIQEMLRLERAKKPTWGAAKEEQEFASGPNAHPLMVTRKGAGVINPLLKGISPDKYRRQKEIERVHSLLNEKLASHSFYPRVLWAGNHWNVFWQIPSRMRLHKGTMKLDETSALRMILDLARGKVLSRLRQCSRCHKWLYAKFRHQEFCSTACQQKHYKDSSEWREKRRNYMRAYRQQTMRK